MKPKNKTIWIATLVLTLVSCLFLIQCGGGSSSSGQTRRTTPLPPPDPNTGGHFEDLVENTFNIDLSVEPAFIEFEDTNKGTPVTKSFVIKNQSNQNLQLQIKIAGNGSAFNLMDSDAAFEKITLQSSGLAAGATSGPIRVKANAGATGNYQAVVVITVLDVAGHIHLPVGIFVTGPSELRMISSEYLCNDASVPQIQRLDLKRAATGQTNKKSFKVCNTGGAPLKINSVRFIKATNIPHSSAFNENIFDDIGEFLQDTIEHPFNYFNPRTNQAFGEPNVIPYEGPEPDVNSAFKALAHTENRTIAPTNIEITTGKRVLMDVLFDPQLNADAGDDAVFEPIPVNAKMELNTSLGPLYMEVVGVTGGNEPLLKVIAVPKPTPTSLPAPEVALPSCTEAEGVDLDSAYAAIHVGTVRVFEDWVAEETKEVIFKLCNRGSKTLQVWPDPMVNGYFTFKEEGNLTFPLTLEPGQSQNLSILYHPTPPQVETQEGYNFGQLSLCHNGGNGPCRGITLLGEQTSGKAVSISSNSVELTSTEVGGKPKNFGCSKINSQFTKKFIIKNNSAIHKLNINWTLRSRHRALQILNLQGQETVLPLRRKEITLQMNIGNPLLANEDEKTLEGRIEFASEFETLAGENVSGQFGDPEPIQAGFKIIASRTGECKAGSGLPVDGKAILLIDRITMNLFGLIEPARNPPSFKFHLPVDLDKENKRVRLYGLNFKPGEPASPVKQIRSYAHQITNGQGCFPLPTNPYKLEFEPGSWNGPFKECSGNKIYKPQIVHGAGETARAEADLWGNRVEGIGVGADGSSACIADNGTQPGKLPDTGEDVQVFYHEFMKFKEGSCDAAIEGKYSTFFLRANESIGEVFDRMETRFGKIGTFEQYAEITRPYQFDSYIKFYDAYNGGEKCNIEAGSMVTEPDQIRDCWETLKTDDTMIRSNGFMDECSYFQFEIEEGCCPGDEGCDADPDDVETWQGCGEYEPDPTDETKMNLTIYNVHIRAFTLAHSYVDMFNHAGRLLYSDLYATMTTKAVGRKYLENENPNDDETYSLVGVDVRSDFRDLNDVYRSADDELAKNYWTENGINSKFTVGTDDEEPCLVRGPRDHCQGNFEFTQDGKLMHAGEACDFGASGECLLVASSSFHGIPGLSPGFAAEQLNGQGKSLYFTFHGCLKEPEGVEENGTPYLPIDAGCLEPHLDPVLNPDTGDQAIRQGYLNAGILTNSDVSPAEGHEAESKAWINYKIFPEDRQRLTNYYNYPNHFNYTNPDTGKGGRIFRKCGFGM